MKIKLSNLKTLKLFNKNQFNKMLIHENDFAIYLNGKKYMQAHMACENFETNVNTSSICTKRSVFKLLFELCYFICLFEKR